MTDNCTKMKYSIVMSVFMSLFMGDSETCTTPHAHSTGFSLIQCTRNHKHIISKLTENMVMVAIKDHTKNFYQLYQLLDQVYVLRNVKMHNVRKHRYTETYILSRSWS